ncbi:hypothetical protein E3P78_01781 [Wallemia ichthyophaga]|nr:hypothetical protein E3P78_01781 [Wallemia ichthyophaga]
MASTLTHNSSLPVSALAWANERGGSSLPRLALGSYVEDYSNQLQVIGLSSSLPLSEPDVPPTGVDGGDFNILAQAHHGYPPTKVAWEPISKRRNELIASTSDVLKLWEFNEFNQSNQSNFNGNIHNPINTQPSSLNLIAQLTPKTPGTAAPLTSFSWNHSTPSRIVTSSIDTTCTVWDLETRTPITQLIAHDREVYDVSWLPRSSDIFVSVGADGSLRAFDLRSLEHSTILYETSAIDKRRAQPNTQSNIPNKNDNSPITSTSTTNAPLLRLSFNPYDSNYLATFRADSGDVHVLDMRSPGAPVTNIRAHTRGVSGIAWKPDGGVLATGGDDGAVHLWDVKRGEKVGDKTGSNGMSRQSSSVSNKPSLLKDSVLSYRGASPVHSLAWGSVPGVVGKRSSWEDWIAVGGQSQTIDCNGNIPQSCAVCIWVITENNETALN